MNVFSGADRDWHDAVLERCPSLRRGFEPSWWLRSAHAQTLMTVVRGGRALPLQWDLEERLTMPDGGTVSMQWLGLAEPEETPVVVFLHTITGSGDDLRRYIAAARARLGWVVVACNRRGHAGLELTAPRINTMGSTDDLRAQIAAIEARRRGAPLYGVGVSAGSGLLVRYLGEEGAGSRLRAGVALCPAYDIRHAFRYVHRGYDRYLTRKTVNFFLRKNTDALRHVDGFDRCAAATTMAELHDRLFPLAGFESREAYYLGSNPMEVARDVAVPVLVMNAADDPVCVERNVRQNLADLQKLSRMSLVLTQRGGHCGFLETPSDAESWADRSIAEYLKAVHELLAPRRPQPPDAGNLKLQAATST